MEDLLDRLGNAKFFSVLDAKCGHHQLPLKPSESEVTGFVVPWGHYEWTEDALRFAWGRTLVSENVVRCSWEVQLHGGPLLFR